MLKSHESMMENYWELCRMITFLASRGLSRRGKMKREERNLCRLPNEEFPITHELAFP